MLGCLFIPETGTYRGVAEVDSELEQLKSTVTSKKITINNHPLFSYLILHSILGLASRKKKII